MARHKDTDWDLPEKLMSWDQVIAAILMDIRNELRAVNRKLDCYRVPRALDAMHELGVEARRRKREAADKRKRAREKSRTA